MNTQRINELAVIAQKMNRGEQYMLIARLLADLGGGGRWPLQNFGCNITHNGQTRRVEVLAGTAHMAVMVTEATRAIVDTIRETGANCRELSGEGEGAAIAVDRMIEKEGRNHGTL